MRWPKAREEKREREREEGGSVRKGANTGGKQGKCEIETAEAETINGDAAVGASGWRTSGEAQSG